MTRVIDLSASPGERAAWGRRPAVVYAWGLTELLLVTNPLQVSTKVRVAALRLFGAKIGEGVIFRPRTRVKFPWKLTIGDNSWIGEGVWIHNQDEVTIGRDVVISQEAFITTGSHAVRSDMALITRPVRIEDGAWVTTRAIILGGTVIGKSAVISPGTVLAANSDIPDNTVIAGSEIRVVGKRFSDGV